MDEDKKIKEAQEILAWAIMHLNGSIRCKVTDNKYKNYRVQFFTKDNKFIMPVQITEEEIKESNPKENLIHDSLKTLLNNLENY
jgi:protein tyrosine/serine phosphatase